MNSPKIIEKRKEVSTRWQKEAMPVMFVLVKRQPELVLDTTNKEMSLLGSCLPKRIANSFLVGKSRSKII